MVIQWKKKCIGAITVEASYISVIIIYVLILLIYIGFYCYDQAVVNADITYLAQLAAGSSVNWLDLQNKLVLRELEFEHILDDSPQEAYENQAAYIEEKGRNMIQDHMLLSKLDNLYIEAEYFPVKHQVQCTVTAKGHLNFPIYLFGREKMIFTQYCTMVQTDTIKNIWFKDTILNGVNMDG